MNTLITAKELSCFYGIVLGLNNVSFTIEPGITGLVGPNGAGKSTLIRLITGQMKPSTGNLTVFGSTPYDNPSILRRMGYCPEHEQVHKELRPVHWLRSLGALSGIPWRQTSSRAEKALETVGLEKTHWRKPIGAFSKGMKQRVKLAQALLSEPELIVLDEPMNGLDPMGRNEIGSLLRDLHRSGVSIIISSHILGELEALCSRFLMVNWGRILLSGSSNDIRSEVQEGSDRICIRSNDPHALIAFLMSRETLNGYLIEEDRAIIWLGEPERYPDQWMNHFVDCPVEIFEVINEGRSLSNLFKRIIE